MGNPYSTYGAYYQAAQSIWRHTDDGTRQLLVTRLSNLVGPEMDPSFPMVNKLVELHLIGKRHSLISASNGRRKVG
jgi:hypothetical protein